MKQFIIVAVTMLVLAPYGFGAQKEASIKELCQNRIKSSAAGKKKNEIICNCVARGLKKLNSAEIELTRGYLAGKFDMSELEARNYPLAEYVFQVNENCFNDANWDAKPAQK